MFGGVHANGFGVGSQCLLDLLIVAIELQPKRLGNVADRELDPSIDRIGSYERLEIWLLGRMRTGTRQQAEEKQCDCGKCHPEAHEDTTHELRPPACAEP
jgi:hypothetical protein